MKDDNPTRTEPQFHQTGDLADERDVLGLARRFERHVVQTNVTLEAILSELRLARLDRETERDRVDQLERDFAEHRGVVADLTKRRIAAARKK